MREILPLDAIYDKDPNMVFRRIGEEMILVPIQRRTADLESIYTLNDSGAFIWGLLDGQHTLAQIRDALAEEYDVALEDAEADVLQFVAELEGVQGVRQV